MLLNRSGNGEGLVTILSEFGSGSFTDTVAAMFAGFAVTAVIQSSSAATGIMIALATQGLLPIEAAFSCASGNKYRDLCYRHAFKYGCKQDSKKSCPDSPAF